MSPLQEFEAEVASTCRPRLKSHLKQKTKTKKVRRSMSLLRNERIIQVSRLRGSVPAVTYGCGHLQGGRLALGPCLSQNSV